MAFICLKGIFKIYYKQQQFLRQAHRQIKNYESSSPLSSSPLTQPAAAQYSARQFHSSERNNQSPNLQSSSMSSSLSAQAVTTFEPMDSFDRSRINTEEHFDVLTTSSSASMSTLQPSVASAIANGHEQFNIEEQENSSFNHYILYESGAAERNSQEIVIAEDATVDHETNTRVNI